MESEVIKNAAVEMTGNPVYAAMQQPVNTPAMEERGTGQGQMSLTQAEDTYDYIEFCPGASARSKDRDNSRSVPESVEYIE